MKLIFLLKTFTFAHPFPCISIIQWKHSSASSLTKAASIHLSFTPATPSPSCKPSHSLMKIFHSTAKLSKLSPGKNSISLLNSNHVKSDMSYMRSPRVRGTPLRSNVARRFEYFNLPGPRFTAVWNVDVEVSQDGDGCDLCVVIS